MAGDRATEVGLWRGRTGRNGSQEPTVVSPCHVSLFSFACPGRVSISGGTRSPKQLNSGFASVLSHYAGA